MLAEPMQQFGVFKIDGRHKRGAAQRLLNNFLGFRGGLRAFVSAGQRSQGIDPVRRQFDGALQCLQFRGRISLHALRLGEIEPQYGMSRKAARTAN